MRFASVSRETLDRIRGFLDTLDDWRLRMNLIGPSEGRHIWRRHVFDSLQILDLIPKEAGTLADLGTGAGFPGVVLAIALADRGNTRTTFVEKSPKKCLFLEAAIGAAGLHAVVLNQRIEDAPAHKFDIVTARALAPLPKLLNYVEIWAKPEGRGLLLKGREATSELNLAREGWSFDLASRASASSPEGQVLALTAVRRKA